MFGVDSQEFQEIVFMRNKDMYLFTQTKTIRD